MDTPRTITFAVLSILAVIVLLGLTQIRSEANRVSKWVAVDDVRSSGGAHVATMLRHQLGSCVLAGHNGGLLLLPDSHCR